MQQKPQKYYVFRERNSFIKKNKNFLKKVLTIVILSAIIFIVVTVIINGSLAQLGERLPYKQDVTGSSPVTPTTYSL